MAYSAPPPLPHTHFIKNLHHSGTHFAKMYLTLTRKPGRKRISNLIKVNCPIIGYLIYYHPYPFAPTNGHFPIIGPKKGMVECMVLPHNAIFPFMKGIIPPSPQTMSLPHAYSPIECE
jgi:hypothetical protein